MRARPTPALLLVLALALLALVPACSDPEARLAERMERGEGALEEGHYRQAGLEFRSALQLDPNLADAHWGLARSLLGEGEPAQAYWELRETLRLDPGNEDAVLASVRLVGIASPEDAEEMLHDAEAVLEARPESWPAHVLRGRALGRMGEDAEAAEALAHAMELAPDEPLPVYQAAELARQTGRPEDAERLLERLVELDPGSAAWSELARLLASYPERDADAEAAYRKALELAAPEQRVQALRSLAGFLFARDRFEEARALLEGAIADSPDPNAIRLVLASLHATRGDQREAEAVLGEVAADQPDDPRPLVLMAELRARAGDLEGALEAVEEALSRDPADVDARLSKAGLLVDLSRRDEDMEKLAQARATLDAVLAQDPGQPSALMLRARLAILESRFDGAEKDLRRALDARPDWAQAQLLLGQTLVAQGDGRGARAALERAVQLEPGLTSAQQSLARLYADLRDDRATIETGLRALEGAPDDLRLRVLVAQALARQGRVDEAVGLVGGIPPERRDAETWNALGRLEIGRDDFDAARRALAEALARAPTEPKVIEALLQVDAAQGRADESAARIADALAERPDEARLHRLAGDAALLLQDAKAAEQSYRRAIELDPNDVDAYARLAGALQAAGKPESMLSTYEEALRANPGDAGLHVIVGQLYEARGRVEEAMARYEEAIRLDAAMAVAKNNLAWLLAENDGDLDRALDLAQEAKAALPDHPGIADTLGWVLYRKDIPSAAVGYLEKSLGALAPDDPSRAMIRFHLAMAYEANGEAERARELAEAALSELDAAGASGDEPPWAAELRALQERVSAPGAAAQG